MRIALLADIHSNREALTACLEDVHAKGVDRIIFLGDYVGYCADPEWCVETIMAEVANGAEAIMGNHDSAVASTRESMNSNAAITLEWTRGQLGTVSRAFLAGLPMQASDDSRLYVHSEGSAPTKWNYVMDAEDAATSFRGTSARQTYCGHVHRPALFACAVTGKLTHFVPVAGVPVPLLSQRRWLTVVGSVGQPRDGNPAAAWSLLDTERNEITFLRVAYDNEAAARKIMKAGLPEPLAKRLMVGR